MLDKNSLSQLQSLKQEIHDSVPRFEGKVRATGGRFGFVVTDDNQQFYMSPEEMEKVLPGDRVAFRVEEVDTKKTQAIIESLISTELSDFCGTYVIKGKGHFIQPDHQALNRWIFVPPKARQNAEEGMLVKAHLSQHPYPAGRAQAEIDTVIGSSQDAGIEARYMCQKWNLATEFSETELQQAHELAAAGIDALSTDRADLTELPLVTIDSASTRDLDDALCATVTDTGWTLHIAIADPAAVIQPGTPLDLMARDRATSAYFAHLVIPMLPAALSEQLCSLQPGVKRLALVAEVAVDQAGASTLTRLSQALVSSQAKLSYQQVGEFMADGSLGDIDAALQPSLDALKDCAQALASQRKNACLVMEDRPDYRLILDENGKVKDIVRQERNDAQRLVEECMLVCNRLCADWLQQHNSGIFIEHAGIRTERIGDVTTLLKEQLGLEKKPKIKSLEDYVSLMKQAAGGDDGLNIKQIISRQLERSNLTTEDKPHMGLGFPRYTTMTSPLRKYNDLLVHRMIAAILTEQPVPAVDAPLLSAIQDKQAKARVAANQTESWLKLQWLKTFPADAQFDAVIQYATANNIMVRFEDSGVEGQIDRRKVKGNWAFDSKTLSHSNGEQTLAIGQTVRVSVQTLEPDSRELKLALQP
ncbi:VacB/RNase II family 3'-5' exoribonuclease [Oceanobacter sp. 5_MG-2023]|uniref:VacB/RNase II family 3'-5' exoribonuclease n=1 Tax=Oceanobacter sp. 5_MG-2023 TaxID=3062645 RepID=UPI0026E32E19|nr:VacB/RNase II family 3'-5' exoribonuclease [Oceanobacter sp. 5_MG-2023]MDO6682518.1 VacB/RNase II family 3'-5' exoribonuclease [Oceanobacter sp. 5_MG-2023]